MVVGDAVLLALALTGVFLFQFNVYRLPCDRSAVIGACLAAALVALAVFSLPKYRWAAVLAVAALGLVLLGRYWDILVQGAQAVYSAAAHVITESTGFPGEYPIPETWTTGEIQASSNCFLTAVIFTLSLPLGWAVVRRRAFFPVLVLTLPWLMPAFLAEFSPDMLSLSMVAACWITLALVGWTAKGDPKGGGRLTLIALPASCLALLVVCLLFPAEDYVYPSWATTVAQRLTQLGQDIPTTLVSGAGSGVPESVDLAHAGPKRYTGQSVLKVESDWTGRLYLRGATYANYTGESWERLDDKAQEELEQLELGDTWILQSRPSRWTHTATVTHLDGASQVAYCPYSLTALPDGAVFSDDSYVRLPQPLERYTLEFDSPNDVDQGNGGNAYRRFVYAHYLDVPEELTDVLSQVRQQAWQQTQAVATESVPIGFEAKLYANYLAATTQYDLQAPQTPAGEDFVSYFLTESHRGYCVHYASTVALLLRMDGIPARYVSGYTAQLSHGEAVVPDSAAHAWVEVYVDSYGWYPIEVTPDAAFADDTAVTTTEPSDSPEQPTPSAQPSETPTPSQTPAAQDSERPSYSGGEDGGASDGGAADLRWMALGAVLLAALALTAILYALRRRSWGRLKTQPDNDRAVLAIYNWYRRLSAWGGREETRLEELAQKAKFSQHTLTKEERREALSLLQREIDRLSAALPAGKRLVFRALFKF
jgi:transglutaminase-like putative cysteine protease